jgi:hypothetical protein
MPTPPVTLPTGQTRTWGGTTRGLLIPSRVPVKNAARARQIWRRPNSGGDAGVVEANADGREIPHDQLTVEDRAALGWAVSSGNPVGIAVVERVHGGGISVTGGELSAIRQAWEATGRPQAERHVHRSRITLVDGTTITGVSWVAQNPYDRETAPSFGLYLDKRWAPPWPHTHLEWPDFGVPADLDGFRAALADALERARRGEIVELGCLGGHGRTGTALACLAILTGTPPNEAVDWVRANYCEKAVETDEQLRLVTDFSP